MRELNQTELDTLQGILEERVWMIQDSDNPAITTINIYNREGEYEGFFKCSTEDFTKAYNTAIL